MILSVKIFSSFSLCFWVWFCGFLVVEAAASRSSKKSFAFKVRSMHHKTESPPRFELAGYESDRFNYSSSRSCSCEKMEGPSSLEVAAPASQRIFIFGSVPFPQFFSCWGVSLPITIIVMLWDKDGTIPQIACAFSVYSIYYFLPRFFGYRLDGPFRFEKMVFLPAEGAVSLERWAITPIFWFCQVIVLLPKGTYAMLMVEHGFPDFGVFAVLTVVSCFFTMGLFDLFDDYFRRLLDSFMIKVANK